MSFRDLGTKIKFIGQVKNKKDDDQEPQEHVFEVLLTFGASRSNQDPKNQSASYQRVAMTYYGYYGFKDLQKTSLNYLLRDLAITLKAKYD